MEKIKIMKFVTYLHDDDTIADAVRDRGQSDRLTVALMSGSEIEKEVNGFIAKHDVKDIQQAIVPSEHIKWACHLIYTIRYADKGLNS